MERQASKEQKFLIVFCLDEARDTRYVDGTPIKNREAVLLPDILCFILDAIEENYDRDPPLSIHLKIISLCLGSPCVARERYPSIIFGALRGPSCRYWGRIIAIDKGWTQ